MRRPLVAGNWKMYTTPASASELAASLKNKVGGYSWVDVAVFPPFTSIAAVVLALDGSSVEVGGQNIHWEKEGAFTGEVSCAMLKQSGCKWVIIGHSERRKYFGEKDSSVLAKTKAALNAGLKPVVCVGETLEQRESGITENVVKEQVKNGLGGIRDFSNVIVAYEPVWAIGTGRNATPSQAQEVHGKIRALISELWGLRLAEEVRILYGGSVKPENATALWQEEDIDGFLVGGASLKTDSFVSIVDAIK